MIGLIIILAIGLRLINLNQPLWLDEAIQFKAISRFSLPDLFRVYLPTDFNPPLSYLMNFGFSRVFGFSEMALRAPSVIFGGLTVWLVFKLGGKWPALLLATSGLHVYYSQEARAYSLVTLAVTASFWALKERRWLIYVLASLAAIYSHYLAWFIFPAQIFWVNRSEIKRLLLAWLAIAIGYLPWLPVFLQQLAAGETVTGTVWGGVIGGVSLKNILLIPVKFLIGRISLENNFIFAAVLALPLTLTGWFLWQGIKRQKLLAVWLIIPAVLIAAVSLFVPVLAYFRLLFILPAFYLLLVVKPTRSLLVGILVFNLITTGIYLFNHKFHREDWRGLARSLTDQPVVIIPAVDAALRYYQVQPVDSLPEENFWYIPYAEPIFDPELKFRRQAADAGFKETSVRHFRGDLTLIQYKR